eukprot:5705291-Pleurochrysis_carterae.AAC.1
MWLAVRFRASQPKPGCRSAAITRRRMGRQRTDTHPTQGRRLTPTGEVWLYHNEPDRWEISPVSHKARILEAAPDAGELAEVVQGA